MKATSFLLALTAVAPFVSAHYGFYRLIINGNITGDWEYVREPLGKTNSFRARSFNERSAAQIKPWPNPWRDPVNFKTNPPIDLACRENAFKSANKTSIATIRAGIDELGFQAGANPGPRTKWQPYTIYHPGPLGVYLSKAPTGNVREYDGSGEWFRIYSLGLNESIPMNETQQWYAEGNDTIRFTIPKTTPPGQYLLRIEHLYPWRNITKLQDFMNCAQVELQGPGGGSPSPLFNLTDYLNDRNPYLTVSQSMHDEKSRDLGWRDPGPPVWVGDADDDNS